MLKGGETGFPIDVPALRVEDVHDVCHGAHIHAERVLCEINGEDLLFRHPVFLISAAFIFDVFLIEPPIRSRHELLAGHGVDDSHCGL